MFLGSYSKWTCVGKYSREIKSHVYGKRQNSSLECLRIENKQIKTVQNNSHVQDWRERTFFDLKE